MLLLSLAFLCTLNVVVSQTADLVHVRVLNRLATPPRAANTKLTSPATNTAAVGQPAVTALFNAGSVQLRMILGSVTGTTAFPPVPVTGAQAESPFLGTAVASNTLGSYQTFNTQGRPLLRFELINTAQTGLTPANVLCQNLGVTATGSFITVEVTQTINTGATTVGTCTAVGGTCASTQADDTATVTCRVITRPTLTNPVCENTDVIFTRLDTGTCPYRLRDNDKSVPTTNNDANIELLRNDVVLGAGPAAGTGLATAPTATAALPEDEEFELTQGTGAAGTVAGTTVSVGRTNRLVEVFTGITPNTPVTTNTGYVSIVHGAYRTSALPAAPAAQVVTLDNTFVYVISQTAPAPQPTVDAIVQTGTITPGSKVENVELAAGTYTVEIFDNNDALRIMTKDFQVQATPALQTRATPLSTTTVTIGAGTRDEFYAVVLNNGGAVTGDSSTAVTTITATLVTLHDNVQVNLADTRFKVYNFISGLTAGVTLMDSAKAQCNALANSIATKVTSAAPGTFENNVAAGTAPTGDLTTASVEVYRGAVDQRNLGTLIGTFSPTAGAGPVATVASKAVAAQRCFKRAVFLVGRFATYNTPVVANCGGPVAPATTCPNVATSKVQPINTVTTGSGVAETLPTVIEIPYASCDCAAPAVDVCANYDLLNTRAADCQFLELLEDINVPLAQQTSSIAASVRTLNAATGAIASTVINSVNPQLEDLQEQVEDDLDDVVDDVEDVVEDLEDEVGDIDKTVNGIDKNQDKYFQRVKDQNKAILSNVSPPSPVVP